MRLSIGQVQLMCQRESHDPDVTLMVARVEAQRGPRSRDGTGPHPGGLAGDGAGLRSGCLALRPWCATLTRPDRASRCVSNYRTIGQPSGSRRLSPGGCVWRARHPPLHEPWPRSGVSAERRYSPERSPTALCRDAATPRFTVPMRLRTLELKALHERWVMIWRSLYVPPLLATGAVGLARLGRPHGSYSPA